MLIHVLERENHGGRGNRRPSAHLPQTASLMSNFNNFSEISISVNPGHTRGEPLLASI